MTPTGDLKSIAILRILDAAANRAREGLRVIEDYVRFVLDDLHLTARCKGLRHDLADALRPIPFQDLLESRETLKDVGTTVSTPSERSRLDAGDVLTANFLRIEEALRSMEEFMKLLDPQCSGRIEEIRYRSYTLHRAVAITRASIDRLASARLCILLDGRSSLQEFESLARKLIEAGVHVVQLRDKNRSDRELVELGRRLRQWTLGTGTLFVMNDRPDLATLTRADGVHVGQDELSVKDARAVVGPGVLIGVSTHSIEQARQAVLDGADYIGVGPTFPSGTKSFAKYPGIDLLDAVAAEIRLPAFAIGGITPESVDEVIESGISRIAVGGAVLTAADPQSVVAALLRKLKDCHLCTSKSS